MKKSKDTLYSISIGIIIAIFFAAAIAAGGVGSVLGKKLDTVKTLDAALTVYDGLITASDAYVTDCAEHRIDQSCVPTAQRIFVAAESTKSAYLTVKQYGKNPPSTVAGSLIASINLLQTYFVQG